MKSKQYVILSLTVSSLFFSFAILAQKKALVRIGDSIVTTDEFKYLYDKNYGKMPDAYTQRSLREYLDMYINFKLKVLEAYSNNLANDKSFNSEYEWYRKQLSQSYLTERSVTDKLLQESYERLKSEVEASHILITVTTNASSDDTLKAFNRITALRKEIIGGKDFSEVALESSEDPSVRKNKGRLGYFTALQMIYEFENAAYNTPIGKVSLPFKTKFGYHLLKVHDKRATKGKVKVAHIMVKTTERIEEQDSIYAFKKVSEIHSKLKKGENWNTLCQQFSDDVGSKNKNGELDWFSIGTIIENFANAAFSLEKLGDISEPIKTTHGWHIIKLIEKKTLESFDELKADLTNKIKKDSRSKIIKKAFLKRIKKENRFKEYQKNKTLAFNDFDSTLIKGSWKPSSTKTYSIKPLFKIKSQRYFIKDFHKFVQKSQNKRVGISPYHYAKVLFGQYVNKTLINYEDAHLEEKYPKYKFLAKEYKEGLLLFIIMEDTIWNRSVQDTTGLKKFFESQINRYQWKERAKATIFNIANQQTLDSIKIDLKQGWTIKQKKALEIKYNKKKGLTLSIDERTYERSENPALDEIKNWKKGNYVVKRDNRIFYILIDKTFKPQAKKLNEVKGMVISEYQNALETDWMKVLKQKYKININDKLLLKLVKTKND